MKMDLRDCKLLVFCSLLFVLLFASASQAQEITGTIAGTVRDSSGGIIPGATVTITNVDTKLIRAVTTDSLGNYLAPLLPIGHYTVSVSMPSFKTATITNIVLNVNEKLTENVTMEVGTVSEVVTVSASPLQVDTQDSTTAGLINGTQVRELSLNNRVYEQLVTLMPGVSSGASDQLYIGTTNPTGQTNVVSFSINGNRNSSNNWTIDGADNVDRGSNLTLLNYPSVDAIAEFKVLRGTYSAEFGRSASGEINVVTRSGSSQFHGDAYEFFRNDVLSANNFFNNAKGIARPPLRYNNFGYTLGGPFYIPGHYNTDKSKTFFFWSQEFRRVIVPGTFQALVPTNDMKNGIFSSPVCIASSGSTCTATATQISNINPVASEYIKDIWSQIPGDNSVLFNSVRSVFNHRQELIKVDQVFSPKESISVRFLHDTIPTEEPGGLFTGSPLPGVSNTKTDSPGHGWVVRGTSVFSPTWLNEAGFAYSYGAIVSNPTGLIGSATDVNIPLPFTPTLNRIPSISLSGLSGIAGFGPYQDYNRNYNIYDNMSKTFGRHSLKFGATINFYEKTENAGGNNVGTFSFASTPRPSGTTTAQQSWANFLLGNVATFTQASLDLTPDIHDRQWEIYLQDDFRVKPNFTLNMGVRYSQFRQPYDSNNFLTNFDPSAYDPSKAPQINPANGNLVPGTGDPLNGIIVNNQGSPYGNKVANEYNTGIGPRFGFAWDPFGKGKTAVRGGYGIAFDSTLFGVYEQNIFANPPYVQNITISNTSLDNPAAGTPVISAAPKTLHGTPLPNMLPYVQQWSLGVQHEIAKNLMAEVDYVGNKGTHLLGIVDLNTVPVGLAYTSGVIAPGTPITSANTPLLNSLRPYLGYNAVNTLENWFNSNYNSLQVSVQKRFSGSSLLNFSYTYSRNLTDNQSDRSTAPQNVYNIKGEYGLAQLDRPHIFTADYVYSLPWFRGQNGFAGHALGGWQISGITTFNSGTPLTVISGAGVDPGGLGILGPSAASPRPDMVGDPNANAPHTIAQWFNTSAFTDVPAGVVRPGNAGRGVVRGPGYQRWDFSVFKNFKLYENLRMQFRAEMFNIFNHTNFATVGTTTGTATYGQVTSTRDPRIVQFGLKFNF